MPDSNIIRVGAITSALNWSFRKTCSNECFDLDVAREYMDAHVSDVLRLVGNAASAGAEMVVGPEYFCGSELFTTSPENQLKITEPADGPTMQRISSAAKEHSVYLAAAHNMVHDSVIAQTGFLMDANGGLVGTHVKHNSIRAGSHLKPTQELFDTDFGKVGILVCADVTDDPRVPLDMAAQGMKLLVVPGVGFAGKNWKHFIIVRAIDLKCAVIYSDTCRAMIVNKDGEVLAECTSPNSFIVADLDLA